MMVGPHNRENKEPFEGTSLEKFGLPLLLLGFVAGFGSAYLVLQTPNFSARSGDSRTISETAQPQITPQEDLMNTNELGKQTYTQTCQVCHQENGEGIAGAFPPLNGSAWLANKNLVAAIVLKGVMGSIDVKEKTFNSVMPPQELMLDDKKIAGVVNYVRNQWTNSYEDTISEEEISELRKRYQAKSSWTAEELRKEFLK